MPACPVTYGCGMGGGAVAGIVIVIVLVLGAGGVVFMARRKGVSVIDFVRCNSSRAGMTQL